jgi:SPP1 gp7 family putative phage head morphogenesis protein
MRHLTREAVKKKFGRKRFIVSKVVPHHPASLEREYVRVVNAYMSLFKRTLAEHWRKIRSLLERDDVRTDAAWDDTAELEIELHKTLEDFAEKHGAFDLYKRIDKLSKIARKWSVNEWKRAVNRTLGIDIAGDYYNDLKFQSALDEWTAHNVSLIKSLPLETLDKMRDVVRAGYLEGARPEVMTKQILDAYDITKKHARLIARDQSAKIGARMARIKAEDAGAEEYIWQTAEDSRVRTSHLRLNGKKYKYSEPPVVDEKTGRTANPGEDYQCRCVALPVFDFKNVVMPFENNAGP